MSNMVFKSSTLASALGVAILSAVLTGSTLTAPDESAQKGDLRLAASGCAGGCTDKDSTRLTRYETEVFIDRDNGVITLERNRIGE